MSAAENKEPHAKAQSRKVFLNTHFQRFRGFTARYRRGLWFTGIVGLLWLALAVRAWQLGVADLTFDEVATVFVARRPLLEVVRYVMSASREHPPLYYLLMALWMRVAGATEFAIRYPSALLGVLSVAVAARLGRRMLGARGGWWSAVLLAMAPFGINMARTGRMYALVLLLTLLIIEAWQRWITDPRPWRWAVFVALSVAGMGTHYYLTLLWAAQAFTLLLFPRQTRAIRKPWLLTVGIAAALLGGFIALSPGVQAMLAETGRRFPYPRMRWVALGDVLTNLYLNRHHPALLPAMLVGVGVTLAGWLTLWRKRTSAGAGLALWSLVPLGLLLTVPENLEARYLVIILPGLLLGLAAALTLLRPHWLRLALALVVLHQAGLRWPSLFPTPDTTYSQRAALLRAVARPGDALVMNGPWPTLLYTYYPLPDFLTPTLVPELAPPGFDATLDIPRLEAVFAQHARVWVSYGAIHAADPQLAVSRWLAENAYAIHEHAGLVLYLPKPQEELSPIAMDVAFGEHIRLRGAAVDRTEATFGEPVRVRLDWEGSGLKPELQIELGLLAEGSSAGAQSYTFRIGPEHADFDRALPEQWSDRRGLWLLPGLPPGNYTLAINVHGEGVTAQIRWAPIATLTINGPTAQPTAPQLTSYEHRLYLPLVLVDDGLQAERDALLAALPRYAEVDATFGERVRLAAFEPFGLTFMQGYTMGFTAWWQALAPPGEAMLRVRLVGPGNTEFEPLPLGMTHYYYLSSGWLPGQVVRQEFNFILPEDLPGGAYHVEAQLLINGVAQPVRGSRALLTLAERARGARVAYRGEWASLFVIQVEERARDYAPPLFRASADARFGEVLRLRGYRIGQKTLRAGESTPLTVYWQAQQRPDRIYAAFNHLRADNGIAVWREDSWPQRGIYTTNHWLKGEVVAEAYTLTIPAGTPPGAYGLYVGIYDAATGDRLSAARANGEMLPDGQMLLVTIEVTP